MTPLRYLDRPELNSPILIAAFAGWSDAGGAATATLQYLIDRWRAPRIAEIDAEEFYDFTQLRPTVKYIEGTRRKINWPENVFHYHRTAEHDLVLFNGIEPHLKWNTYANAMLGFIEEQKIELVVTVGAMFVEYPHTRPLRVTGTAPTPEMEERAGLHARRGRPYEGPTGINGVLNARMRDLDIPAATVWANVPHYVSAAPNPPATLALLRSLMGMLNFEVPLGRMVRASNAFDAQLNEATAKNSEVSEYVRQLEERVDAELAGLQEPEDEEELPATESIVQDIEEFLRRSTRGEA